MAGENNLEDGQNATFAFSPGNVPTIQDFGSATATAIEGGVTAPSASSSGNSPVAAPVKTATPPQDQTYAMLMDAGEKLIGPAVKEARNEAFVDGMQQVANGAAVKDIVDQQPWYSKIFGSSDVVAGARAYAGHAAAAQAAGAMEDAMPQLRTLDADDASKAFSAVMQNSLTGDATTDAQIQSSLMAQMPALMRRQAKENYAYKQGQAAQAEAQSMMSGAKALQSAAQGTVVTTSDGQNLPGATTPQDLADQSSAYVNSLLPAAGRDLPNWQLSTTKTLKDMAEAGYFHALNAVATPNSSGVSLLDGLTEDQKQSVLDVRQKQEMKYRDLNEAPYIQQIATISASMKYRPDNQSVADLTQQAQDVNSAYQARTGSQTGLLTNDQITKLATEGMESVYADRKAFAAKQAAATAKAQTQAEKDASNAQAAATTFGMLKSPQGVYNEYATEDQKRASWAMARATPQGIDGWAQIATNGYIHDTRNIDTGMADRMKAPITGPIDPKQGDAVQQMYQNTYLPLYSGGVKDSNGNYTGSAGASTAAAYLGDDLSKKMRIYANIMTAGGPGAQGDALNKAFIQEQSYVPVNNDKTDKAMTAAIKDAVDYSHFGVSSEFFGTDDVHGRIDLRDDQMPYVAGLVKYGMRGQMINPNDVTTPTNIALKQLQAVGGQGGLNVLGGYAWQDPSGTSKFTDWMSQNIETGGGIPNNKIAASLRDTLAQKITAVGGSPSDVTRLVRNTDGPGGEPQMVAYVTTKAGDTHTATVTGSEIKLQYATAQKKAAATQAAFHHDAGEGFSTPYTSDTQIVRPNLVGANPRANVEPTQY